MKILISLCIIISISFSNNNTALYKKGEKIVNTLCNKDKEQVICPKLSNRKLEAVNYYLNNIDLKETDTKLYISVPKDAKCPVCGMFVYKYPKWSTKMVISGKDYYFDGVKDMMKYYIFNGNFKYDREKIEKMLVSDYYTLKPISAKDAFFVYDSNVFGPMGREFISFKDKKSADTFMKDHNGKKILRFIEITDILVMKLDA